MKTRQKIRNGMILLSFFLFPAVFYYLSPVLVIQAATQGVINGSLIMFLLMFIGSLFLGRAYCGWICPGAGCQEAMYRTRNKRVTKGDSIKWILWVPWIIAIVILTIRAGGYKRVDFLYHTTYGFSIGSVQALISYLIVLLFLIILPAFVFGKRSFCHHICWMAPFMIAGRELRNTFKWPSLKLAANPEKCQHCHTCTQNCPMSLPVEQMINENKLEHKECILCGTCIDGCEFDVIGYSFRSKA